MVRKWSFVAVLMAVIACAGTAWSFDLTVLHVNDSHSYLDATKDTLKPEGKSTSVKIGAWARLQTAVSRVRGQAQNVALLHAGDAVQGDLYFMKYGGRPEMEFLNRLDFTAMTLGNHEFDKGPDFLAGFLKYTKVPVVSANIDASAIPILASKIMPYFITSYGGEKVGIIGLTTKETAIISSPGNIVFADEAETARQYIKELEAQGINKIILLTHVGLDADKRLAATVSGVDIIVGGHSHSLLGDSVAMEELGEEPDGTYPVVVKGVDGNDVYVVTAWKWGRVLGRLDVTFDDIGRVTAVKGNPVMLLADTFKRKNKDKKKVELEGVEREEMLALVKKSPVARVVSKDNASEAFLEPFREGVNAMRTDVIGIAAQTLSHIRVPGVDESGLSLPHGSLIAPIVCQSMLAKMASTGEDVDIALLNGGGVRDSIPRGNITVGTAYTLMPFSNTLNVMDMTGAQVKRALEIGVTRGAGAFPYVGGARYTADMNKSEGNRITRLEVKGGGDQWKLLDVERTYRVVTNSYLAGGGDGYVVMKDVLKRYDTGFVDAVAFIEYVKAMKTLLPIESADVNFIPTK
ncbi:bifunctional metallophosphatase/5'-nucleotidase [Pseudodesulfovibrio nedwellii]|uniref:Bifunctional metallophosphatase/5'-nucleotidase n=1 Tax=Pseudodesulfovibrio nedwellii TaxID=2973072 RepID=A0ABN6S870_9BACT|nr:5'-nucleotidase C-terminal domain-containing protein [Pseudodesulfovibrio nedwellii]BDQ38558.1 bifunctional metallophosphatase/5'-nucleotidase [Pseudodesulfovibrio nedwellii]